MGPQAGRGVIRISCRAKERSAALCSVQPPVFIPVVTTGSGSKFAKKGVAIQVWDSICLNGFEMFPYVSTILLETMSMFVSQRKLRCFLSIFLIQNANSSCAETGTPQNASREARLWFNCRRLDPAAAELRRQEKSNVRPRIT